MTTAGSQRGSAVARVRRPSYEVTVMVVFATLFFGFGSWLSDAELALFVKVPARFGIRTSVMATLEPARRLYERTQSSTGGSSLPRSSPTRR